jgi:programmed cell death 6-interacting protein
MSQGNLKFELANILYNLAALYSQLAASANRGSADGLKSACNNFCLAAGVISHLKTNVIPELRSTFADISKLKSSNEAMFSEGKEILRAEPAEDKRPRLRCGMERLIARASNRTVLHECCCK